MRQQGDARIRIDRKRGGRGIMSRVAEENGAGSESKTATRQGGRTFGVCESDQ